jgi:hypothetical protein
MIVQLPKNVTIGHNKKKKKDKKNTHLPLDIWIQSSKVLMPFQQYT